MSVQQEDRIEMSQRERDRLKVLHGVKEGQFTQAKAAELLGLTARQVRRLQERLAERGDAGLVHRLRGQPSNRQLDAKLRRQVLREYRQRYADFGPTFACEKLAEQGLHVSPATWRRDCGSVSVDAMCIVSGVLVALASASWCRWTRRCTSGPKAAARTWCSST
jgi:transposase